MRRKRNRRKGFFQKKEGIKGVREFSPSQLRKEFIRSLEKGGIVLKGEEWEKLWRFHHLLREGDRVLNLTRIRNFYEMVEKHYIDSLLVRNFTSLPSPLMDLGTGGGFPGIPLAIVCKETFFYLVEGRRKRALFLERVKETLSLPNVKVVTKKWTQRDFLPIEGVITRAFGPILEVLSLVYKTLPPGGRVIFMKGPKVEEELRGFTPEDLGYSLREFYEYLLPFSRADRVLLVYEKVGREKRPSLQKKGRGDFPPPLLPERREIRTHPYPLHRPAVWGSSSSLRGVLLQDNWL
jgi:16S rRNA (guanine527-N7)-methyltransferase